MTNIDLATMHLQATLATVYRDIPCGLMHDDCRTAIWTAYDALRTKYQKMEEEK
jgi:hypothetical protein